MEDSWIESDNVEHIFLYKEFEKLCPFFISIGMTYEQFWRDDVTMTKMYLKAYKMKVEKDIEMDQWNMWKQGMYTYEALCDVSPVLHAFSKKGTKPLKYPKEPYPLHKKTKEEEEEENRREVEKVRLYFENWSKRVSKDIKSKQKKDKEA